MYDSPYQARSWYSFGGKMMFVPAAPGFVIVLGEGEPDELIYPLIGWDTIREGE